MKIPALHNQRCKGHIPLNRIIYFSALENIKPAVTAEYLPTYKAIKAFVLFNIEDIFDSGKAIYISCFLFFVICHDLNLDGLYTTS